MAKPTKTRKERKRKAEEDKHDSSEDHRTLPPPAKKRKQVLDNPDKEIKLKENIIDKAEEDEEAANAERVDCENVVDEAEEEEEAANAERVDLRDAGRLLITTGSIGWRVTVVEGGSIAHVMA
ncbi:hypothetical protein LTR17_025606 [Elasticomyces elasticus]|nr:hypothetical protein LTR17_025606 [Elasticomyces elasticus]